MKKIPKNEHPTTDDEEATPEELRSVAYTAIMIILAFLAIIFLIVYLVV